MMTRRHNRFSGFIGEDYELFMLACPHFNQLQTALAMQVEMKSPEKLLEIGCGTGYTTATLLSILPSSTHITSIDNEPVMLEQAARNLAPDISSGRVSLVTADALTYLQSLGDNSVEAVVSAFTLHNFPNAHRRVVMAELYRVLKRGSIFFNADKYAHDDEDQHAAALEWQLKRFQTVFGSIGRHDLLQEWHEHYLRDNQPDLIMREGQAIAHMKQVGFRSVRVRYRNHMEAILIATK